MDDLLLVNARWYMTEHLSRLERCRPVIGLKLMVEEEEDDDKGDTCRIYRA